MYKLEHIVCIRFLHFFLVKSQKCKSVVHCWWLLILGYFSTLNSLLAYESFDTIHIGFVFYFIFHPPIYVSNLLKTFSVVWKMANVVDKEWWECEYFVAIKLQTTLTIKKTNIRQIFLKIRTIENLSSIDAKIGVE